MWLIRDAGVTRFRIDAAKHIQIEAMRKLITSLTDEIRSYHPEETPVFLMEYWSGNPHRLNEFLRDLGPECSRNVYLFDYPFAMIFKEIALVDPEFMPAERRREAYDKRSFGNIIRLLKERNEAGLGMSSLIPLMMDHDFLLPIYNGHPRTLSTLVFGYTLMSMLYQNRPHLYMAFDKSKFAPSTEDAYRSVFVSDYHSIPREPIDTLFEDSSPALREIKALSEILSNSKVLRESSDIFINYYDYDSIVIERRLDHLGKSVVARLSRGRNVGIEPESPNTRMVYEFISSEFSTRIYEKTW
jgi:hypothetical protein